MTATICGGCDQPTHNQAVICRRCEAEARRKLASQPSLREELSTEYQRLTRKVEQLRIKGRGEWPLLFEPKAAQLMRRQRSWLSGWAATVARLRNHAELAPTITAMAVYVEVSLPILRNKPEAAQLLAELRELTRDIVACIDLPAVRTKITAGPCPKTWLKDGFDEPCPGTVDAIVPADETIPAMLRCTACHAEWPSHEWTRAGRLIMGRRDELQRQRELAQQFTKGAA